MKKIVRIFLGLVLVLIALVVAAILFIGTIVKTGVEKVGPRVARVSVKLDRAKLSIFDGSGALKGFVSGTPARYKTSAAINVGTVAISLVPASVLQEKKHISSIRVEGPEITYETD